MEDIVILDGARTPMAGPAASWKVILPSLAVVGEPFRLAILAEDVWGNLTGHAAQSFKVVASQPLRGLPSPKAPGASLAT